MQKEWVISIRNQCRRAKVPFFFKQWGGVRKKETGRKLAGRTYDQMPRRSSNSIGVSFGSRPVLADQIAGFC